MLSLDEFLRTHGKAAERIARGDDEIFNESLVLKFKDYVARFNGIGDIKAYVLMRMRFTVLKLMYNRAKFERKYGAPLEYEPVAPETAEAGDSDTLIALRASLANLDPELHEVVMLWANGYTQQEISAEVAVCIRTVRHRLRSALITVSRELGNEIQFD